MSDFDFTSFLKLMVHKQASDLFITAGVAPSMKVQGRIVPITQSPLSAQQSRDMVLNVMTPAQREEFEKTHECQFAISASGVGRFRVSCFYQRNCVGMVLRRIESKIPTPEELNLPPVIKQLAMTKRGIIIFVGGTGTGKSTSLASMIGYRNQNSTGHIITIEDPIEYVHKHEGCIVTQRELGIDTDSWENALKNTLRQAPDVILIGEIRDEDTAMTALEHIRDALGLDYAGVDFGLVPGGELQLVPVLAAAVAGAVLGDGTAFWIGHRSQREILTTWPMANYPHLVAQSEAFFQRWGALAVFFARFLAPIRAFVPITAGALDMAPLRFYAINIPAIVLWALAHVLPGVLAISALHQYADTDEQRDGYFHVELMSVRRSATKLKFLAGSESAMDAFISDVTPETVAERLRGLG